MVSTLKRASFRRVASPRPSAARTAARSPRWPIQAARAFVREDGAEAARPRDLPLAVDPVGDGPGSRDHHHAHPVVRAGRKGDGRVADHESVAPEAETVEQGLDHRRLRPPGPPRPCRGTGPPAFRPGTDPRGERPGSSRPRTLRGCEGWRPRPEPTSSTCPNSSATTPALFVPPASTPTMSAMGVRRSRRSQPSKTTMSRRFRCFSL